LLALCKYVAICQRASVLLRLQRGNNGWTAADIPTLRFILPRLNAGTRSVLSDILTQRSH